MREEWGAGIYGDYPALNGAEAAVKVTAGSLRLGGEYQ